MKARLPVCVREWACSAEIEGALAVRRRELSGRGYVSMPGWLNPMSRAACGPTRGRYSYHLSLTCEELLGVNGRSFVHGAADQTISQRKPGSVISSYHTLNDSRTVLWNVFLVFCCDSPKPFPSRQTDVPRVTNKKQSRPHYPQTPCDFPLPRPKKDTWLSHS